MYVTVSDQTSQYLITLLKREGFNVKIIKKNGAADARRKLLDFVDNERDNFYHYCDLDRLVTWSSNYPQELLHLKNYMLKNSYDYIVLGRTSPAFNTHPVQWRETEKLTNNIFSINFGRDIDITAGSSLMSNKALEAIKAHSSADVTDAEWPFIIKKYEGEGSIDYLEYNGLEYLDWNKSNANSDIDEWLGRTKLTYRIVKTISHFVKE